MSSTPPDPSSYSFETFFPTTILMADYPDAPALNETLADSVYRIKARDEEGRSASRDQYGVGYTSFFSKVNVLEYPGFGELAEFVTEFGHRFAGYMDIDLSHHALGLLNFWVNINPTYSFHHIHIHPEAVFSGVFYVVAPEDGAGGEILFKDPRPGAAMLAVPLRQRTNVNSDSAVITPKSGRLLMFPAWLPHGVNQNLGAPDRISVSYNIGIKHRSELG